LRLDNTKINPASAVSPSLGGSNEIQATLPLKTTAANRNSFAIEYFVDAHEAATFLKITPRRIKEMSRKGQMPAHPIGEGQRKVWRYRLSELSAWMSHAGKPGG
jgi:hypothetical protein